MEALTDKAGKQVNTATGKEERLGRESFPPKTTTSTTRYPQREAHTQESLSKPLNEPYTVNQSK